MTIFSQLLDFGWAAAAYLVGAQTLLYAAPLTILGEALVISHFLHPVNNPRPGGFPFRRAVIYSLVMNFMSGILGLITAGILPLYALPLFGITDTYFGSKEDAVLLIVLMMICLCIVSIALEGCIMWLMDRQCTTRSIWRSALFCNLASYLVMNIFLAVFILRWA